MTEQTHHYTVGSYGLTLVEDPDDIDNPVLAYLLSRWRQLRDGAPPSSDAFESDALKPWVLIADALPSYEDFRFRTVGTHLDRYFLGNGSGRTIRDVFARTEQQNVDGLIWLYRRVCEIQTPLRLTGSGSCFNTLEVPDFDAVYLPLTSHNGTANTLLNAFTFHYSEYRQSRSITSLMRFN